MTKKQIRETVFNKCDGKCAYCGTDLDKGWNIDHIRPKVYGGTDNLENLNPSCKDCNNYKCHSDLETFRMYAKQMLNDKLHYLFKSKTKMQVAINMGVITYKEWDGVFFFERIKEHSELSIGDKILVFGELETVIERIEGDRYYFKDEDGKEWKEDKDAIKKL